MAKSFLTTGDAFQIACGRFIICDTASTKRLCCLTCSDGVDSASYSLLVPCGPLLLTLSTVNDDDCDECSGLNDDWELQADYPGNCESWSETFDLESHPCVTAYTPRWTMTAELRCCYNSATDKLELWANVRINEFPENAAYFSKKLDEQDFVDGACYFYDWSSPNETLSYVPNGGDEDPCHTNITYFGTSCDFTLSQVVLSPA